MTVINTNTAATLAANALTKNERAMSQTMERLSTGQRINSASDDAAGLAISSRMTSQVNGLNMAVRNTNDAISMVQTADGALVEVTNMLQRMRELTVQAATGTMGTSDIAAANTEFTALRDQIQEVAKNTEFNGTKILDGSVGTATAVSFQVGANASQTLSVVFGDLNTDFNASNSATQAVLATGLLVGLAAAGIGSGTGGTRDLIDQTVSTADVIATLDNALANVNEKRSDFGAAINRLEHTADNLANVSQNASASRSRILDADYASETTELARTQIIQQAGTAMLSQANQQAQSVLALLK
jgi:flagellin